MIYPDLGFVNQNPDGTIPVSEMSSRSVFTTGGAGSTGTMVTQISYINDPTPTSYATSANYKRITVTVATATTSS